MSKLRRERKRRLAILRDEPLVPSREWPYYWLVLVSIGLGVGALLVDGIYDGGVYRQYVDVYGQPSWRPVRIAVFARVWDVGITGVEWLARWCAGDWPLDSVPSILRLVAAAEIVVGVLGILPRAVREELLDEVEIRD